MVNVTLFSISSMPTISREPGIMSIRWRNAFTVSCLAVAVMVSPPRRTVTMVPAVSTAFSPLLPVSRFKRTESIPGLLASNAAEPFSSLKRYSACAQPVAPATVTDSSIIRVRQRHSHTRFVVCECRKIQDLLTAPEGAVTILLLL